jgi:hypothetical protein
MDGREASYGDTGRQLAFSFLSRVRIIPSSDAGVDITSRNGNCKMCNKLIFNVYKIIQKSVHTGNDNRPAMNQALINIVSRYHRGSKTQSPTYSHLYPHSRQASARTCSYHPPTGAYARTPSSLCRSSMANPALSAASRPSIQRRNLRGWHIRCYKVLKRARIVSRGKPHASPKDHTNGLLPSSGHSRSLNCLVSQRISNIT